ncbi:MAG: hydrogenase expression/formation protein HypE [Rhodospirillaceae bacterium]
MPDTSTERYGALEGMTHISLAHGNGGRLMRELIDGIFVRHLANPNLDVSTDAALLHLQGSDVMVTTDGFTVQPLIFPGGDIGSLAINGTVNDLAVVGATPLYLCLSAIIEEGLEVEVLDRIIQSAAAAAEQANVKVVAGDTKVVPRGYGGGLYLVTTGVGRHRADANLGLDRIQRGDKMLVSGPVGSHGAAVMFAREEFGFTSSLQSDCACVLPLTEALYSLKGTRFMRDPTRGGLATVAHEISVACRARIRLWETLIPVQQPVLGICDALGYDPYYLACEGRVVAIVAEDEADKALSRWQTLPQGRDAAIIGQIEDGFGAVLLETELGGERLLEELEDDPLPRIC